MPGMARACRRLVAAALVAVAVLATPAAARTVTIGIGDQNGRFFTDARFGTLGIRHARLLVPWDAHKYLWQVERLDRWLDAAHRTGVVPLIVFDRSVTEQYRTMLPSVEDFAETVDAFRARYPWVREFATWNEPNHCTQPTCGHPELVAAYYDVLRRKCSGCRVLGASILGVPGMAKWVKRFLAAADSAPAYWGLHNYLDVNDYNRFATRKLLQVVKGKVWLTETAGLVSWRVDRQLPFRTSATHARFALEWLFDWLLPAERRVTRVYLYQWDYAPGSPWDSALIGSRGKSRPALSVVRRAVRHGVRRLRPGEKKARRRWVKQHMNR
jgi:hypothetical protein